MQPDPKTMPCGLSSKLCRPLREVENEFVQILISKFKLHRTGGGVELDLEFDKHTPAIWKGAAKKVVRNQPHFAETARILQTELDDFLLQGKGDTWSHDNSDFPFRYVSGGVLPIIRVGGHDYFCLFYRDIFPIGWNIANGGSDNTGELLNPIATMEREFREELMIIDPEHSLRFNLSPSAENPSDYAEFAVARFLWQKRFARHGSFANCNLTSYKSVPLTLRWLHGPDSLVVRKRGMEARLIQDCFLNINADDYGIEVDRVAKISLSDSAILCDGEIIQGRLLDAPVALFSVERMAAELHGEFSANKERQFIPDKFFIGGCLHEQGDIKAELKRVLANEFLKNLDGIRPPEEIERFEAAQDADTLFRLCPVTLRIIHRHLTENPPGRAQAAPAEFDTFISFAEPDTELAKQVRDRLIRDGKKPFFSKEDHSDTWVTTLFGALESCETMIVVTTHPDHLARPWPQEERENFIVRINKGKYGKLLSFIKGITPAQLPMPLGSRGVVVCSGSLEDALNELKKYLDAPSAQSGTNRG